MLTMTLDRRTPCLACPFWRRSLPGYINSDARNDALLAFKATHEGSPLACVMSTDKRNALFCAGQLIMLKNMGVEVGRSDLCEILQYVDADHSVFSSMIEFQEHHTP